MNISIHAAREGGDGLSGYFALLCLEFQSTPPVKAATLQQSGCPQSAAISIHAAREGGDNSLFHSFRNFSISIHAAREGGDAFLNIPHCRRSDFNPRRP